MFGDEEGVHVTDDRGLHWTTTHVDEDRPELLVEADDGTLLLSTRSGRLLRSADGGDTWVDPGDRIPAMASILTPRPAFAAHPDVLIGTRAGVWLWSEGAAPARWAPFQRLDNTSGFWDRTDPPAPIVDTEAAMDSVQGIPEGTTFAAWVRGDRLDVIGRGDPDGGVIVSVDGATVAQSLGDAPPGIAVLVTVDGLTDAWHRLELRGVGTGILLDAVEIRGEGASLPSFDDPTPAPPGDCPTPDTGTASTEEPGCGCATDLPADGTTPLVAGILLLATRRRRATTTAAS